jgi:sensor histidine kinase YesM
MTDKTTAEVLARQDVEDRAAHMHPLEVIPLFRRWPKSLLRDVFLTLIFNTIIAAFFVVMAVIYKNFASWNDFFAHARGNWVIANVIGFTFHFVYSAMGPLLRRVNRLPFWAVVLSYTVMGAVITQVGFVMTSLIPGFGGILIWMRGWQWVITSLCISFVISLILGMSWRARMLTLQREATQAREGQRLEAAERAASEANLRALQAQIEPHFLFNTLANVDGLIHADPDKAKHMLEQFIVYLRSTLAETRETETTLAREFELMKTYLAVLQIRMGERLNAEFDLPQNCRQLKLPPMLLQPLVENAIKHGLEPKVEGGSIAIQARLEGEVIKLVVCDTGIGFSGATSSGLGLSNVRERVQKLFNGKGSVMIEENRPQGTRVTLTIPQVEIGKR